MPTRPTHYRYSRLRATLFLLAWLPFGGYLLAGVYGVSVMLGWPGLRWIWLPLVPLYLWSLWRVARKLWWREPVLTLDSEGLTDHVSGRHVPWRTVRQLYIGPWGASTGLLIAFQSTQSMERALGGPQFLDRKLTRLDNAIIAPGAAWGVALGPLACRSSEVLQRAQRLHAQALGRPPATGG